MWRRDSRYGVDQRLLFVVNARDAKHVPGRKTDISDAQWLQRLHSYGLLRASFRPKGQIAELRAYVRQRERLIEYAASHFQHMQKALTEMNLQLHHVVADVTGATGLRIIRAILAGERDSKVLACLRDYRCHSSAEAIEKALTGNYRAEHLFALEQALALYNVYQDKASACNARIEAVKELSISRGRDAGPLPSPRRRLHGKANGPDFDVRAALFKLLGKDLTQIDGLGSYLSLRLIAVWRRPLRLAERKALYLLAMPGAKQQDLRRKGALVTNTPLWESGLGAPAACCRNRWTDRHGPGRILQAAFGAHRQGQGNNCHGAQDRRPVLQRRASRDGIRRPRLVVLRDTIPHASGREFASPGQSIRFCSAALGVESWCRFLGIVLQRQLSNLGVQRLHIDRWRGRCRFFEQFIKAPTRDRIPASVDHECGFDKVDRGHTSNPAFLDRERAVLRPKAHYEESQ